MLSKEKEIPLPTSRVEFQMFVDRIAKDLRIEPTDDLAEALGTAIMHLDNRIGRVRQTYFRDCALKFLANKTAYEVLAEFAEVRKAAAKAAAVVLEPKEPAKPDTGDVHSSV